MSPRPMWRPAWMSGAAFATLILLALPFLSVTHAGQRDEPAPIAPASQDAEPPPLRVSYSFSSEEASGAVAWILDAPEPGVLGASVRHGIDFDDYDAFDITLLDANGPRQPPFARGGADNAHWLMGDGVAYAGVEEVSFRTPPALTTPAEPNEWGMGTNLTAGRTVVLVTWARQTLPLSIVLDFPAGVTLEEVRGRVLASYEFPDGRGGVQVGIPAAARAHVQNRVNQTSSGGFLYTSVSYWATDIFGMGGLEVTADDHRQRVDWTNLTGAADDCPCTKEGQVVASSTHDVNIGWDYVGDGRRTQVFAVVAEFPTPVLPFGIWLRSGIWGD